MFNTFCTRSARVVLLIGAYAWGELQVNRFVKNNDRIFLLKSKWANPQPG